MTRLAGRHVLLVEDEAFIGMHIEDLLLDAGAQVVGPAQTVALALMMLTHERVDAAVLDLHLEGRSAASVGAALDARRIPSWWSPAMPARRNGTASAPRRSWPSPSTRSG
ncbi:response regulator [Paeniroseomonas aquatica]|uniref:response regulator n=1 Tax=Paeniroseomonas aquatica TaxID=373043 RepID=UPI00361742CD